MVIDSALAVALVIPFVAIMLAVAFYLGFTLIGLFGEIGD